MLHSVRVVSFKSIVDQTIELGQINCLIGANGVGKSNLLEAIGILGAAAGGRVDDEAILRRGVRPGVPKLYKSSFSNRRISPAIVLEAESQYGASYKVSLLNALDDPRPAWEYKTEVLYDSGVQHVVRGPNLRNRLNLDASSGFAALKIVELPVESPASALIRSLREYAIFSPNTPTLRGIAPDPQPRTPVGLNGGALAEGLESIMAHRNEETIDSVLELIDWASSVQSSDGDGTMLSASVPRTKTLLQFTDRYMANNRRTLTAYDASEGALYVLFAAILCLSDKSPSIFAIENLDSALNPRLATRLVQRLHDWILDGQSSRQIVFTTHNPTVLDGLRITDPKVRLFAVERNSEGHTIVRRIEPTEELLTLHATYPLSRLWAMGNLGAVPNV